MLIKSFVATVLFCLCFLSSAYCKDTHLAYDSGINGLEMTKAASAKALVPKKDLETFFKKDLGPTSTLILKSKNGTECAKLKPSLGDEKYTFSSIEMISAQDCKSGTALKEVEAFKTTRGISLGMTVDQVKSILGKPTKETTKAQLLTLQYQVNDGDPGSEFLSQVNMPQYEGTYEFTSGKLTKAKFGFPTP